MIEIRDLKTYNDTVAQDERVVVKVGTPWCGPCSALHNTLVEMEPNNTLWTFAEINADVCDEDLLDEVNVDNIPVLIYYMKGREVDRTVGALSADAVEAKLTMIPLE